jgi:hypothetical protein
MRLYGRAEKVGGRTELRERKIPLPGSTTTPVRNGHGARDDGPSPISPEFYTQRVTQLGVFFFFVFNLMPFH